MDRRIALTLGLVVLVAVVADVATAFEPNTWIYRDGRFYVNVNENILDEQSLQDPFAHSWYNGELGWNRDLPASFSNIALGRNGEYWHFRPYLLPVLSTPLYWAFGLVGVLIFNILGYGIIAGATYRFARAYAGEAASVLGAVGLVLASGVAVQTYNYSPDILLLALFTLGCAAMVTGRGLWTGVLLAAAITIKPPTVIYAVPLAMIFWERRDWQGLKRAILGGAVVLGIAGAINTYMFGRPWWFGYNRALIVVDGEQRVFDDAEAFQTPLLDGLRGLWSGQYGVRDLYGVFLLAIPGLARLAPRHPRYVIGTLVAAGAVYVLFSKFAYQYDRFLFPAFAMLVPALAAGAELLGSALAAVGRRLRGSGSTAPALATAAVVVTAVVVALSSGADLGQRMGDSGWVVGATAIGDGVLDLQSVPGIDQRTLGEESIVTRTRFSTWVPRASPLALLVAAPFTATGDRWGLLVLHVLAAGLLAWASVRVLERAVSTPLAVGTVAALSLLPPLGTGVLSGGPDLLAAAVGVLSLHLALSERWTAAAILSVCAAWMADAPWLGGVAVLGLAWGRDRDTLKRVAFAGGTVLALWGLAHLVLYGRPFASPDDFVVVGGDGAYRVAPLSFLALWESAILDAGPARALVPLAFLAPLGVLACMANRAIALVLGVLMVSVLLPGVAHAPGGGWSVLALIGLGLPLAPFASRAAESLLGLLSTLRGPRRIALAVVTVLAVLAVVGGVRRGVRAAEPFRMASWLGVRHAEVTLDHIPCDFLAWENMSWECASFDGGVMGRAGLALPRRPTVDGAAVEMWLVPTGRRGARARHLRWRGVAATDTLALRYAAADGFAGGATVTVRVDGEEIDRFPVPADLGEVRERSIDTSSFAGEAVDLEIVVSSNAPGRQSGIVLDGWFQ